MYFLEFMAGALIGIAAAACLIMLILLLAKAEKPAIAGAAATAAAANQVKFSITRREIADDTRQSGDRDIAVREYPNQPQLPTTLKYRGRTYAMLYATDKGVLMTVRIADDHAEELSCLYPGVRRASFPRTSNWYCVPVEGAFAAKEDVYRILSEARAFTRRAERRKNGPDRVRA